MTDATRSARLRPALFGALGLALLPVAGGLLLHPAPAHAQTTIDPAEQRLRKLEAELRAVQRKVFPDGAGRTFGAEITAPSAVSAVSAAPAGPSPVTDLLTRMDTLEAQVKALTAATEEHQNRMAKLEARIAALEPPPASALEPATTGTAPTAASQVSASAATPTPPTVKPATAAAAVAPRPAGPSAERIAAVAAIEKPSSDDKAEDEYSYGYRLWEAKFFPEAQQQLLHFAQTYPKHKRISYARNLLGRAYLDDNKPGTAAQWFVQNYLGDKQGDRAADSLLYLGVAMTRLKEVKRACTAFAEFKTTYPIEFGGRLKSQYEAASKAVTCD